MILKGYIKIRVTTIFNLNLNLNKGGNTMKRTRLTRISLALVLIAAILATGLAYAGEAKKNLESLEEKIEYMGSLIKFVEAKYKYDVTEEELIEGAYNGIFDALDKHSTYFNPDDYESFNVDTSGTFGGIGVSVGTRNDNITIIAPIEGTPGDKAGLKAGDIVKYVDDIDITGYNLEKAVHLMRGEAGTKIKLGIIRGNSTEVKYFEIVRDIIEINPVEYEIKENNIGYIMIRQFNANTYENMAEAVAELLDKKVDGFIIDLRNNPGGSLSEVVKVSDYFLDKKTPIVHIEYKGDNKTSYKARIGKVINKPIVVLVNEGSASASEIFAGAIQDTKTGTIVGTQTYGKGTVQTVIPITNGGGVKLTIAEYLTSNGRKIDGIGLTPDIVVENHAAENRDDIISFAPMIEDVESKKDDKGLNIYGAQQRLGYLGYDVEATGILDEKTYEAIKKFQESQDISPDGTLDFETRNKLSEETLEAYQNGIEDLQLQKAIEIIKKSE